MEPDTLAKLAQRNPRCPFYKLGHGRGGKGPRYSWAEVQALKVWLEEGRP